MKSAAFGLHVETSPYGSNQVLFHTAIVCTETILCFELFGSVWIIFDVVPESRAKR